MKEIINKFICADVMAGLKKIPAGVVNTCVTSPPYWGLRDYGMKGQIGLEKTPGEYVKKMITVFREVRRVLRDDGTLWLNLGDAYSHGGSGARDPEAWPKQSRNADGWGGRRPHQKKVLKPKDLLGIPWHVALALQADGWYLRADIIWHKPNPMPESVTDRPTKSHEYIFLLAKSQKYYYDAEAIKEAWTKYELERRRREHNQGLATIRNLARDGQTGLQDQSKKGCIRNTARCGELAQEGRRNKQSVWTVTTQPYLEAHFATFPEKLIKPCVLAGAPEGGIVLDPFGGAGTTALVSYKAFRKFIHIDLNKKYIEMAKKRLEGPMAQQELFKRGKQ